MRVVLDEGVPEPLSKYLAGHVVESVRSLGLKGIKNGKLLSLIEMAGFDALITNDKRMEAEQQLERRPFAILILSATNWPVILPHFERIASALDLCRPGTVTRIDCGKFIPKKDRKPAGSNL